MRIRINAKLSPLLFTCSSSLLQNGSFPDETFQTHVCQLNQSPWDVIPFASNNSSIHQFEDEEDGFKNGDYFVALGGSVASMMENEAEGVVDIDNRPAIEKFDMMVLDDNQECCNKNVVNNIGGGNKGLKRNLNGGGGGIEAPLRRGRGRPKKPSGSNSNNKNNNNGNDEFYFYSGFGPLWGKQRKGDSKSECEDSKSAITLATSSDDKVNVGNNNNDNVVAGVDVNVAPCYSEGLDYVEDYEDDYGDIDNGERRMRKPVKERSLKSLM